jgi:hypothetical protein
MRVIAAGIFVFAGITALIVLVSAMRFQDLPRWFIPPFIVGFLGLIALAYWLFNPKGTDLLGTKTQEEHIRELESQGLLDSTDFQATRAFEVEEFEDEGTQYYLELADGRVLFLIGQYLYDYSPDPDLGTPRRFPCSEFTVRRHKVQDYVAEIQCRGAVLEPEFVAPPFNQDDWKSDRVPYDGKIITDRTYEELKRERRRAGRNARSSG